MKPRKLNSQKSHQSNNANNSKDDDDKKLLPKVNVNKKGNDCELKSRDKDSDEDAFEYQNFFVLLAEFKVNPIRYKFTNSKEAT